jgi:hypothetical protein
MAQKISLWTLSPVLLLACWPAQECMRRVAAGKKHGSNQR